jgi:hypothetical protein
VREYNALLRSVAIDMRHPGAKCPTLPRRTRAELRGSPQRIAAARARLARLRLPNSFDSVRTRPDEGLRLIAETNKLLLASVAPPGTTLPRYATELDLGRLWLQENHARFGLTVRPVFGPEASLVSRWPGPAATNPGG